MAIDISAASYESGRRALQLAVAGDSSSVEEIASLLVQEAKDHCKSSCLDDADGRGATSCHHHTALEVAASAGDAGAVERLLAAGADPNAPIHELGISALEAAAVQGRLVVVERLLGAGAHPDQGGRCSKTTPLIAATMAGHTNICEALLERGADVTIFKLKDEYWGKPEVTAIEIAAGASNTALLELFLGVVDEKAQEFDGYELEHALSEGRHEECRRLLWDKKFLERAQVGINRALDAVAANGDTPTLQRLLDAGADITDAVRERRACDYPSAIAAAASGGHLEAMSKLLQAASDQDMLPGYTATDALQFAVNKGHKALCEALIHKNADATIIDIRRAALEGHFDVLKFILQSGACVEGFSSAEPVLFDAEVDDLTALQLAASHGHKAVVDLLLDNGADIDGCEQHWTTREGATALRLAVSGGHFAVTERLVRACADVNAAWLGADTPLQAAIRMGDTAVLDLLLTAGADVDVVVDVSSEGGNGQDQKKTALSVAAEVGNIDLTARLLSMMSQETAQNAVPWALLKAIENRHAHIVRKLLQTHPDVNARRGEDKGSRRAELTFLQTAAAIGDLEILELLLSEGADANLDFTRGWHPTALQSASERGELAAVKLLLAAGADINVTGSTAPPLLLAVHGDHVHVFEFLLAAGADIHATAYRGQTLLEAAEESGGVDILDRVRAALKSRPSPPPIDRLLCQGNGRLCETCQVMPFLELISSTWETFEFHPSLEALRTSVAAGCPF